MFLYRFKQFTVAFVAAILSFQLQAAGVLEGRISDQSGKVFFEGAIISIEGTNIETTSGNDGRFRFSSLTAGEYKIIVSYIGADNVETQTTISDNTTTEVTIKIGDDSEEIENIIVFGQAAGAFGALNQMRASDNLISVVASDSIGQLPDENVSEALQRISGVFIERDQGEGRFVGIRGLDPSLNLSKINGLNIPAPESDKRHVALDVIPSDLVETLEVTKSLTPDQDADAIGGTINIKSLSAFDRDGMSYKLTAQGYHNDLESEGGHKLAATYTNVFDFAGGELGVAVSASTNERKFGTDNIESDGGWEIEDGQPRFHEEFEMRDYQITRERDGFALNLDYRASATASYYLRSLYSKFSDQEFRNRIEFKLDEGDVSFDENSLTATNTEVQRELKDRFEEQEITSIALGGENIIDEWTIEYTLGLSKAEENEPGRIDSEFVYEGAEFAGYRNLGLNTYPSIFASADTRDASNFELNEIVVENNKAKDEETSFNIDVTKDMKFGEHTGYIKFGAKLRSREKENDVSARVYDGGFDSATLDQFVSGNTDFTLGRYGPYIDYARQRAFVANNVGSFEEDTDESRAVSARDYTMEEDITALYLMSRIDVNDWRFVYGVRYEQTDLKASGSNVREVDVAGEDDIQIGTTSFENDYSHVLPSINVRYSPSDDLIMRAAYTQSIARPSFGQLTPTADTIEIETNDDGENELSVEAGNPELEPYEAQNIDFSVDYYPGKNSVLSAGLFYKQIDNFIFSANVGDTVDPSIYAGNVTVDDVDEIILPLNGESADLMGLEFSWTRQFMDLPSPYDGFLLMANATFTNSEADLSLAADGRDSKIDLPLQADEVYNFAIGYEKYGFSLRLSYAHISERILEIDVEDSRNDLYEDSHKQIDFTAKYNVNNNFQVFFSAINLNEEPNYRYRGEKRYLGQYDEIGQSYILGVTYRNF